MKTAKETYDESVNTFKKLGEFNPAAMSGFIKFVHATNKDSALSAKIKQIILVSASLVKKCEWCIVYHTKKALDLGATREELLEACITTSLI
ncbi:MAG: carboxymuconolactone decarboxylase family protein, partial [Promethearchaeota archaeon]